MAYRRLSYLVLIPCLLVSITRPASTQEPEPETPGQNQSVEGRMQLTERVVVVVGGIPGKEEYPLGTGFRLLRPNLIVTARHVTARCRPCFVVSRRGNNKPRVEDVQRIETPPDPQADIAALLLESSGPFEHFRLPAQTDIELGMRVGSFGYPAEHGGGVTPRLLLGHIQRVYEFRDPKRGYRYSARELSFPSFGGQSGSPVFSNQPGAGSRENAIAVVTTSIVVRSLGPPGASASWAVALSLFPFAEWLSSL